jgi:hypothetical protein
VAHWSALSFLIVKASPLNYSVRRLLRTLGGVADAVGGDRCDCFQKCIAATTSARGAYCASLMGRMHLWGPACMASAGDKIVLAPTTRQSKFASWTFLPRAGGKTFLPRPRNCPPAPLEICLAWAGCCFTWPPLNHLTKA